MSETQETADLSTDEIVALILDGDGQAYRHLVLRYQGEVAKVAHAMLRDRDYVEDVVQQVFIKAFRNLDRYEAGRSFELWIKGIARNTVKEELRKKFRYQGRVENYARHMELQLEETAGHDLFGKEAREAIEECLDGLEENAARAIRMHYLEHRKTDEIGDLLGRSGNAVRTLMFRARLNLRDCLVAKGIVR